MKRISIALFLIFVFSGCAAVQSRMSFTRHELPPAPADPRAYSLFMRGSYLIEQGDYKEAEDALKQALAIDPSAVSIHGKLAELYLAQNRLDEARSEAAIVLKDNPNNVYMLYLMGVIEASRSDYRSSKKYLEKARKLRPGNDDVDIILWRVLASLKRYGEAVDVLEELAGRYPEVPEIYMFMAQVQQAERKPEDARKSLLRALEINPNLVPALIMVGDMEKNLGNNAEAENYYRRALDLHPNNPEIKQRLAQVAASSGTSGLNGEPGSAEELGIKAALEYLDEEKYEQAVAELENARSLHPHNTLVAFYLGLAYEGAGRLDDALAVYQSIPAESSLYNEASFRRAVVLNRLGRYQEAITAAQTVVSEGPQSAETVMFLAIMYLRADRPGQAIDVLEPLHDRRPDDMEVYYYLGQAYGEAGREDDAIKVMRRILEKDPENAGALNYIGYSYAEKGVRLDEAELLIMKALKIMPDNPSIIDSLGWLYYQQGKMDKAIAELERAYNLNPEEPVIAEHLADAYLKAGRKQDALSLYKKALELNPNEEQRARIEEKIGKLEKR